MSERNSLDWLHKHVPWLCTNITVHGPRHSPTFTAEITMRGQVFRASASTKKKAKSSVANKVVAALTSFQLKNPSSGCAHETREHPKSEGDSPGCHHKQGKKFNKKRPILWNAVSILNDMRPHIKFIKSIVDCKDFNVANHQIELLNSRPQSSSDLHCLSPTSSSSSSSSSRNDINDNNEKTQNKFSRKTLVAMTVTIDGRKFVGVGGCQKSAKQRAAREALKEVFSLQNMFT